jgi:hypothetical protein
LRLPGHARGSFFPRDGSLDFIALRFKQKRQQLTAQCIVIDYEK